MIAGAGFAMMAWRRAQCRIFSGVAYFDRYPQPRAIASAWACSREYYRIIDSATAAWPAFTGERSLGICPRIAL